MKTILAIDDQKDNLTTIRAVIKANMPECKVLTALSGKEGIDIARNEQPDTILLDIIMPQMDGYEVCKRLKEDELTKHIPIIMITAITTDSESRVKGLNFGADAFLSKPIDPVELSAQVNVMLRIKGAEDKLRLEKDVLEETVLARTHELKESEEKYKALYDNAPLAYHSLNEDGNIKDVNPAWLRTLGYNREEVNGKWFGDFLHSDWKTHFEKSFSEFKRCGYVHNVHFKIRHKEGHYIDILSEGCIGHYSDNSFKQTYCVFQDITERKKAEDDLIAALKRAEESDRLKSAFLANMSHEIRTPMNGMLGFAELLKDPDLTGEQKQQYLSMIEISSERMLNIINDLIDISKIESGQMEVSISATKINEQIEYLNTFFKPEVEQKGMQLFYKTPLSAQNAIIRTDQGKINAILTNLINNAIKFTDEGSIEFGYNKKSNGFEFFVKDTGIGVPKNHQQSIFERFVQADHCINKLYEGAGLGLSISKAYVEMLGGKIWVESEEGKGSVFYFTIPT